MTVIDFDKVNQSFIDKGNDIANLELNSYILSNKTLCEFRMLNILNSTKDVFDELNEHQKQNVLHNYNNLIG